MSGRSLSESSVNPARCGEEDQVRAAVSFWEVRSAGCSATDLRPFLRPKEEELPAPVPFEEEEAAAAPAVDEEDVSYPWEAAGPREDFREELLESEERMFARVAGLLKKAKAKNRRSVAESTQTESRKYGLSFNNRLPLS